LSSGVGSQAEDQNQNFAINETVDSIVADGTVPSTQAITPTGVSEQIKKAKRLERKLRKEQARKEREILKRH